MKCDDLVEAPQNAHMTVPFVRDLTHVLHHVSIRDLFIN